MDDTPRSYKPIWWALTIVAFIALCAWAYVATRRSNEAVQQANAAGAVGTAYDPTTGRTVPAGATPGAFGTADPVAAAPSQASSGQASSGQALPSQTAPAGGAVN
jgi:hypothetical protein